MSALNVKHTIALLCFSLCALCLTSFVHAQHNSDQAKTQVQADEKAAEQTADKTKKKNQKTNKNKQKKPSSERFIPSEEISEDSPIAFPVDI